LGSSSRNNIPTSLLSKYQSGTSLFFFKTAYIINSPAQEVLKARNTNSQYTKMPATKARGKLQLKENQSQYTITQATKAERQS